MNNKGKLALTLAAVISIATAIAHLSCIFIGPACFAAQMAPQAIIDFAVDNTMLAPIATLIISGLFISCGFFALSGAGFIKKLPYMRVVLVLLAVVCVVRGIATIPLSFLFPDMVRTFSISAGVVWFSTGLLFAYGYSHKRHQYA